MTGKYQERYQNLHEAQLSHKIALKMHMNTNDELKHPRQCFNLRFTPCYNSLRGMTEEFSKNLFNSNVVTQCSLASCSQLKKGDILSGKRVQFLI